MNTLLLRSLKKLMKTGQHPAHSKNSTAAFFNSVSNGLVFICHHVGAMCGYTINSANCTTYLKQPTDSVKFSHVMQHKNR